MISERFGAYPKQAMRVGGIAFGVGLVINIRDAVRQATTPPSGLSLGFSVTYDVLTDGHVFFHASMLGFIVTGYFWPALLSVLLFDPLLTSPEVQAVAKAVPIAARQLKAMTLLFISVLYMFGMVGWFSFSDSFNNEDLEKAKEPANECTSLLSCAAETIYVGSASLPLHPAPSPFRRCQQPTPLQAASTRCYWLMSLIDPMCLQSAPEISVTTSARRSCRAAPTGTSGLRVSRA